MERTRAPRSASAGTFVLVVLLVMTAFQVPAHASATLERQMLRLTNAAREQRGLHRLRLDASRSDTARKHSVSMGNDGGLFHTSDPVDTYLRGVRWYRWGENVGDTGVDWGSDLRELQNAFMASPEHRANVLEPGFRRLAVGVVRRDGEAWVTLFFYG
ncbi:MAG: CAP domain-containing protein [Actinomycetota bacterium]